ncbi:MAG: hypothetical protein JXA14_23300 [Anaerolineae bacterium]|nr:hypothetical protein [Anaerolineae bacterium]
MTVSVDAPGHSWVYPPGHAYPRFLAIDCPDVSLEILPLSRWRWTGGTCTPAVESERDRWKIYTQRSGLVIEDEVYDLDSGSFLRRYACFDSALSHGQVFLPDSTLETGRLFPLKFKLDFLLAASYLARHGGGLFHGAGVACKGKGIVLSGPSGSGKTTLAALWRSEGGQVLNPDVVGLRQHDDGVTRVHGTPWWAEDPADSAPIGVPVAAICFLAHGVRNELRPLPKAEAIFTMVSQCVSPVFYDSGLVDNLVDFCAVVADTIPIYRLTFRPDREVVSLILDTFG